MKRRDFLTLSATALCAAVLPTALSAPALGKGWDLWVVAEASDTDTLPPKSMELVHEDFARIMKEKGYTEIKSFHHEAKFLADERRCWLHVVSADMR